MSTETVKIQELVKGDLIKIHDQHAIVKRLSAVEGGWELTVLVAEGVFTHPMSYYEALQDVPKLRRVA